MNAEYHEIMTELKDNPAHIFLQDDDEEEDEDYGKKGEDDEEDEDEEDENDDDEEQDGGYSVGNRAVARPQLPKNP